jgi:ABC-type phosphate transport system substrate-binding protein
MFHNSTPIPTFPLQGGRSVCGASGFYWLKNGLLSCFLLLCCALPARAELVVVVCADSSIEHLSRQELINIYMGRYRKLQNKALAIPLDIAGESPERRDFYRRLLDKTLPEINAYWARLVFSGKTTAPAEVNSQREVLERVANDPNAIGYMEKNNLNARVKVVYEFED